MPERHPELVAALAAADGGDYGPILGIALRSQTRKEDGFYCECAEPVIEGADLMCGACLCSNRSQEIAAVHRLVDAHDLEDHGDTMSRVLGFCDRCTMGPDAPRHNGVGELGRTSWGGAVQGRSADGSERQ